MKRRGFLVGSGALMLVGCTASEDKATDASVPLDTDPSDPPDTDAGDPPSVIDTDGDTARTGECGVTIDQTPGPFELDIDGPRSDLSGDGPGLPLTVEIQVVDHVSCDVLEGATVDLWHANRDGVYSGFASQDSKGEDFFRGEQVTDAKGTVVFTTRFPGFYPGRTAHLHVRVRAEGYPDRVTQLYFDTATVDAVQKVYGKADTDNDTDGFYTEHHRMAVSEMDEGFAAFGLIGMTL
ncbi:MAG: hypothetical protein ACON4N_10105 [Myxococcota bacterium]